jgi:nucleotide-binding universal stress UspA family protein
MLPLPAGSAIQLVTVVDDRRFVGYEGFWTTVEQVLRHEREQAEKALGKAAATLAREGVTVTTAIRRGLPAREILRAADGFDADLVVVGSKGLSGLEGFLVGSVARAVAKRCERPVLVAREPTNRLREVIVAVDGSDHATHAAQFAARLPLPEDTERTFLHVVRPQMANPEDLYLDPKAHAAGTAEVRQKQGERGAAILEEARRRLADGGARAATELRVGDAATEILRFANERHADLIVAGARGVSLLEGLLTGSVADRLLKDARCSVLIVR